MLKTTIAMIPVHFTNGKIEILLQKRINSGNHAWFHTWEFPQGKWEKLPEYSFLEFAEYKFKNETGMQLDSIQVSPGKWIRQGYAHCVPEFDPFILNIRKVNMQSEITALSSALGIAYHFSGKTITTSCTK